MKNLAYVFIITFVINFAFLSDLKVSGQTDSPDNSSSNTISSDFNGLWQAKFSRTITVNGTIVKQKPKVITLKLCTVDNELKGTVNHPGFFKNAPIVSSKIITSTEVQTTLKDNLGRSTTLDLTLNSDKTLSGAFDSTVTFKANKRNKSIPKGICGNASKQTPTPTPTSSSST